MPKRAILHIPHAEMLATYPVKHWIERFRLMCDYRPTEVVVPAVVYGGPTFQSSVLGFHQALREGNLLPDWIRQVRAELGDAVPVWASIIPAFGFLKVETVMIEDQYGVRFDSNACIQNPTVQKVVERLVGEIADGARGLTGIAYDLTDIYPNSGSNVLTGIQNTCFCSYCLREMNLQGWSKGRQPFLGKNNISRFVLRLTESGADHLEPRHEWIRDTDSDSLLSLSLARGFTADGEYTLDEVRSLLDYLSVRGKITANAVRKIAQPLRDRGLRVASLLGDSLFDMTQSTDLDFLVESNACDEYWLPAARNREDGNANVLAQYLFSRGSYFLNAFFETIGDADGIISGAGVEKFIARLIRSARFVQSNRLNSAAALTLDYSDEYSGFVGVPLSQPEVVRFVEDLTRSALGGILPPTVIEQLVAQVRVATPSRYT